MDRGKEIDVYHFWSVMFASSSTSVFLLSLPFSMKNVFYCIVRMFLSDSIYKKHDSIHFQLHLKNVMDTEWRKVVFRFDLNLFARTSRAER